MVNKEEKDKVQRLFQFLKEYNNIKNPIIVDIVKQPMYKWLVDIPVHKCIKNNLDIGIEDGVILSVKRPELTHCPKPDTNIISWLKKGWEDPFKEAKYIKQKSKIVSVKDENDEWINKDLIEYFESDNNRVASFKSFSKIRSIWAKDECITRKTEELFNELYSLYSTIKKEPEALELVFGNGILYYFQNERIQHPVLLQNIKLEFDAEIPEFSLVISDKEPELYKSLLSSIEESDVDLLKDLNIEFDSNLYSPLDKNEILSFIKRIVHIISAKGEFIDDYKKVNYDVNIPIIYTKPVIFLRKRNLGFSNAIDSIIDDINATNIIPSFIKEIVGLDDIIVENTEEKTIKNDLITTNGIDEKILLTKAANYEQLIVAKQLSRKNSVLVQGPPGTGKTHTIANMIGNLLSEGKSILVTSYSEKALSVLTDKVSEELQSLCLSLLSSTESKEEMDKTLDIINTYRSTFDKDTLSKEIKLLEAERRFSINKLRELKVKLKNSRLNEYRPITIGAEEITPIDAAKFIKENKEEHSWIPGDISPGYLLPLFLDEMDELYSSNTSISIDEEKEFDCKLPKTNELPSPIEFTRLITNKNSFTKERLEAHKEFFINKSNNISTASLEEIKAEINKALVSIDINKPWILECIESYKDDRLKGKWENLIKEIKEVYDLNLNLAEDIIKFTPEFIDLNLVDVNNNLDVIINKLEAGGKLSGFYLFTNKEIKRLVNSCRINKSLPQSLEEFKLLSKYHDLLMLRDKLKQRWNVQTAILGADNAETYGVEFELILYKYCSKINEYLNWYLGIWTPVINKIKAFGINISSIINNPNISADTYSDIKYIKNTLGNKLVSIIDSEIYRINYSDIIKDKEKVENIITLYSLNQNSKIINRLIAAISEEDTVKYNQCIEDIKSIRALESKILTRREQITRLGEVAPQWAKKIENREGIFGLNKPKSNAKIAWKYIQLKKEINRRNSISIQELQKNISDIEENLRANSTNLAFKKSWISKLTDLENNKNQLRAIESWRQLIKKVGKGKGKRSEAHKAEARKLMPQCQGAVPVWIMPLNKVVENFNPKENKFDVVIIDEASQADVLALVAIYLGKQVIIVGDSEQVSPMAVGEKIDEIDRISKQYLYDSKIRTLYSGKLSIYDLAQMSGYQPIKLKEHFRCVPEIIQFSSNLSYRGEIKALRDVSSVKTKLPIITYKVIDGSSESKQNIQEAEAIVSVIQTCTENLNYNGKSMGVITLRGEAQAKLIDNLLHQKLSPIEYQKRNIQCGTSATFQGDERDVIFISMVDANDNVGPMRHQGDGNDDAYKKRYNVAVSRARDQLWVIHSMDHQNDLKEGDLRKKLLDYCYNYKSFEVDYQNKSQIAESEFEKSVMKYLIERGYKITPQWKVGSFRIDMVASYKDKKVAIECDGERWHGEDKLEEDMNRQVILERLGWRFIRIRGSEFYQHESNIMEKVIEKLNAFGIYPESNKLLDDEDDNTLRDSIIRRSEEIIREWHNIKEGKEGEELESDLIHGITNVAIDNESSVNDCISEFRLVNFIENEYIKPLKGENKSNNRKNKNDEPYQLSILDMYENDEDNDDEQVSFEFGE